MKVGTITSNLSLIAAVTLVAVDGHAASDTELGWAVPMDVPQLPATDTVPFRIERVRVDEARAGPGFAWQSLDGRIDSRNYSMNLTEWPTPGNGVSYQVADVTSLHVWPAPERTFNLMVLRGGFVGELRKEVTVWETPWDGELVRAIQSHDEHFRWMPDPPVELTKLTFVFPDKREGHIADLQLFRVGAEAQDKSYDTPIALELGAVDVVDLDPFIAERFGSDDQSTVELGSNADESVPLQPLEFVHLATPPLGPGQAIGAVTLNLELEGVSDGNLVRLVVHDPLNPRGEILNVDVAVRSSGWLRVTLDFVDQVFSRDDRRLWISLASRDGGSLKALSGLPAVELRPLGVSSAMAEYLPYRRTLLRSQFQVLSEPRPWAALHDEQELAASRYRDLLIELRDALQDLHALAPDDPISREYWEWIAMPEATEHDVDMSVPDLAGIPLWAELQHEAELGIRDMVLWWYGQRLVSTGELGSRINDDTDFSGHVVNLAMTDSVTSRPIIASALHDLTETVHETSMDRGLSAREMDALHSYEEGSNLEGIMAWVEYGDPVVLERIMQTTRALLEVSAINDAGHRHFTSPRIGAAQLDSPPLPTIDTGNYFPFMQSPLTLFWYSGHSEAERLAREFMGAWLEHFAPAPTSDGKPIYPAEIDFATDEVLVTTERSMRGGYSMAHAYMAMYWLTGEEQWLYPFELGFDSGDIAFDWGRSFGDLLRRADVSPWRDKMLNAYANENYLELIDWSGYLAWLLSADPAHLEASLRKTLEQVRRYPWMYTEAEPYADRVFFPHETITRIALGGQSSRNQYFSTRAVSFEGFDLTQASLVYDNLADRLRFAVCNLGPDTVSGRARLWQLEHGRYAIRTGPDANGDGVLDSVASEREMELARFDSLPLEVAPGTVLLVEIDQLERLDDIRSRPDLALSSREKDCDPGADRCTAVVHNVGSRATGSFRVAIVDAELDILQQRTVPSLASPDDLIPVTTVVEFDAVPPQASCLLVDPTNKIAEITEVNNVLALADDCPAVSGGTVVITPTPDKGCCCRHVGRTRANTPWLVVAFVGLLALGRRRRRGH